VRYPDIYTRGGNRKYLLLQFSPMLHHDRLAAVSVHLLREDEYYSLQLPYWGLPLPSADSSCAASAIFGFDGASFSLHSCSSSFPQLSGTDAEQLSARLLLPCRSSDALRCGFQNLGGTRYLCAAAPRPDGSVHTAILKFDEIQAGIENSLCILSPREREITGYVVDGLSAREISQRLLIAEGTVKKTVSNIYSKLDVSSKVDLIHRVLQY
jgi:DNA-binding CsgD family transcriptional regulator